MEHQKRWKNWDAGNYMQLETEYMICGEGGVRLL